MTGPPRLLRRSTPLVLAALWAACGGHKSTPAAAPICQLPPPQPSALPTLPATAAPGQSQAIHYGVLATGQTFTVAVPAGTASVTIVEQAGSSAVPLTIAAGGAMYDNTPVPLSIQVAGNPTPIFFDVPMPPNAAFRKVPAGTGITVLDPVSDPTLAAYFFSSGPWIGALTLPNTSVAIPGTVAPAGVPEGTWTVTVGDWAYECNHFALGCTADPTPSLYDVTVILKPASAASALQVVFYLVTTTGLTAAAAPSNPNFVRMQSAITQILGQAGIAPSFQYRDVSADVRAQYATGVDANGAGVCGGLGQLLQLAEPGNQLNVFLVDLIKDTASGAGYSTVGLDPIVPAPASMGGTPASGVVVSLEHLGKVVVGSVGCPTNQGNPVLSIGTCGNDNTAAVVAHEAGHFMGLYHDTEYTGTIVDPLADTGSCLCPLCKTSAAQQCQGVGAADPHVASPYRMQVTDCLSPAGSTPECGGGDNLMFWLLDLDSKGLLTAGQGAVMRASPLVQ